MLHLLRSSVSQVVEGGRRYAERLQRGGLYRASGTEDLDRHLAEASKWLARAQDAGTNRGVAYGADLGGQFLESYPETTGYIIPTFLELSRHYRDSSWKSRAVDAGDWESVIQMAEGAVMGGMLNGTPTPAVFNTGMVLLGWAALLRDESRDNWRVATNRACDWLLRMQDPDGCWRRGNSIFAKAEITTYNVKAAWGLCEAGVVLGREDAIAGAVRNAEYCLTQQSPNGWFANNCLTDPANPLLHTTAYATRGLIGIGLPTGRNDLIDAAARTARSLISAMREDGFIPGRSRSDFSPGARWCCLTGSAQIGIVWGHLYQITGDRAYLDALERVNRYLMRHHDVDNADTVIRGGVPGSWPTWAEYGRLRILNWATNFFVESLLMQRRLA
ncbi:MAG TPA: hypothetical protein VIP11_19750 [Gemmatimonadaceae bacterium]